MKFPVLAFFDRAMRMEARVWGTYAGRMTAGIFVLSALFLGHQTMGRMGAPGLFFFKCVSFFNVFLITGTFGYFANAITEEKEDGTMGFLKMTGLSSVSILLGKSATRWFGVLLLLLAQAPFIMLAIVLGGVTKGQVVAAYGALIAYLFFVGNLSLFCSVLSRRSQSASYLALFLLGTFFFLPPLWTNLLLPFLQEHGWFPDPGFGNFCFSLLSDASPYDRLQEIMVTGFGSAFFSYQVLSNLGLGAFFFLLSWRGFERFTQEQNEPAPARLTPVTKTSRWGWFSPGRVWEGRALAWKEFYFSAGGWGGIFIRFGLYALLIYFFAALRNADAPEYHWRTGREVLGNFAMIFSLLIFYVEAIGIAVGLFGPEVKWKTLSTVVMLPLSVGELLRQKWTGHWPRLIPCGVYFGIGALLAPQNFLDALDQIFFHPSGLGALITVGSTLTMLLVLLLCGSLAGRKKVSGWMSLVSVLGVYAVILFFALLFAAAGPLAGGTVICVIMAVITVVLIQSFEARLHRSAGEN